MDYYSAIWSIRGIGMVFKWPKRPIFSFFTIRCIEIKHLLSNIFGRCTNILTFNSECPDDVRAICAVVPRCSEALVQNNAAQVTLNNFWVFLATIHNNIFERKKFIGFFTYYKVYPHFCLSGLFLVTLYSIFHKRTF